MSEPVIPEAARLIAERLFTNGMNQRAARLRLELQDKSDGGGWSIDAAYDQIKQVTGPLEAKIAEQAATIERLRDALELMYDKYENGVPCTEDGDVGAFGIGNAVRLSAEEDDQVLGALESAGVKTALSFRVDGSRKDAALSPPQPEPCDFTSESMLQPKVKP